MKIRVNEYHVNLFTNGRVLPNLCNIIHPFMESNGRNTRIWLDLMLKRSLKCCVDWSQIDKNEYLSAMRESVSDSTHKSFSTSCQVFFNRKKYLKMVILKIEINNIKGIGNLAINENIYPNRPNILVAPNGFGKSSLAVAFKTLVANKIELKPEEEPTPKNGDPSVVLSLSTGQTISADKNSNTIRESFSIHVVTNPLLPTAKAQRFGKIVTAKASMNIEPTVVIKTIPMVVGFKYNLANMKRAFGASNKILMDISRLYSNYTFLDKIEKKVNTHIFELKPYRDSILSILAAINHLHTNTAREIKDHIVADSMFAGLCPEFHTISAFIKEELDLNDVNAYLCAKINRELRTYLLQPGDKYDPLAVCFAVRRRVEELVYLKLQEGHRRLFLSTHGTNEKLHEAQSHGVSIPETYFLLGIVYNHPLHIAGDEDLSKPLSMKLDNPSIKNMIRKLW